MSKYEVVEKLWKSAKFSVNIVQLPFETINDKLAVLSDGTGTLTFSRYDIFLLNSCVLDAEKILMHLESVQDSAEKTVEAALELRKMIIEVNPLLDPELLVINNENIIRVANQNDKLGSVRRLVDNPSWDLPEYDDADISDIEDLVGSMGPPSMPFLNSNLNPEKMVPHQWAELDLLLIILTFNVNDVPEIFKDHYSFEGEDVYKQFVVTRCILDFQNLFILLDRMGYTKKYGAEKLTEMLYTIAIQHNSFLSWEDIDLEKVKKAVERKFGKKTPSKNIFKKAVAGEKIEETSDYKEFMEIPEERINTLSSRVKEYVVGQNHVIDDICDVIKLARCGFKEEYTPIGSFLLTGESGTGKTYLAKILAQELCGSPHNLVRVDCGEFSHSHEIAKLLGSPPGYVGSENTSRFFETLTKNPFSIVLFDEIEKAHSKLHDLILSMMDEGTLTSGKSETLNLNQTLILMTSNIGVNEVSSISGRIGLGDVSKVTFDKRAKALTEAAKKNFKPEFIGRLDSVVTFNTLDRDVCLQIVKLQLKEMNKLLTDKNISIQYDDGVVEYIYGKGFRKGYGARPLKRTLRKEIFLPMAKMLLESGLTKNAKVRASIKEDKLDLRFSKVAKPVATRASKKTKGKK